MNRLTAALCVALAARIHKDPSKVRQVAKRCLRELPGGRRRYMCQIMKSNDPLRVIREHEETYDV